MRTTVTLDDDAAALVQARMRERGVSFKQALNDAIRAGAPEQQVRAGPTRTADLGTPTVLLYAVKESAPHHHDDAVTWLDRPGA